MTEIRNQRRVLQGLVVSDKGNKTITIEAHRLSMHPKFKKFVKRSARYAAHDENNEARTGDLVEVVECRPLSKTKKFRLLRIVRRGKGEGSSRSAVGGEA